MIKSRNAWHTRCVKLKPLTLYGFVGIALPPWHVRTHNDKMFFLCSRSYSKLNRFFRAAFEIHEVVRIPRAHTKTRVKRESKKMGCYVPRFRGDYPRYTYGAHTHTWHCWPLFLLLCNDKLFRSWLILPGNSRVLLISQVVRDGDAYHKA